MTFNHSFSLSLTNKYSSCLNLTTHRTFVDPIIIIIIIYHCDYKYIDLCKHCHIRLWRFCCLRTKLIQTKRTLHLAALFSLTAIDQHNLDPCDKGTRETEEICVLFHRQPSQPAFLYLCEKRRPKSKTLKDEQSDRRCGNSHSFAFGVSDACCVSSHLHG